MRSIIIADDHSLIRAGLKQIVAERENTQVLEASNGQEVMSKLQKQEVELVILDISMPGRNGLEVLKEIKQFYPKMPVLMLSVYPEDQYAIRALKAGAAGYLTKDSAPDLLLEAIDKVMAGGRFISPAMAEKLITELSDKNRDKLPHEKLSDREFEVLCKIGEGKQISDIGEELFLSVKTISTYRARILEKMALKNNAELIYYVINNKLLEK